MASALDRLGIRFVLFGAYPSGEQWRPAMVCLLFVSLYAAAASERLRKPWLPAMWMVVSICAVGLMRGGMAGLTDVPTEFWGGLPLTCLLSSIGFAAAIPLAVALALGRRSQLPAVRVLCTGYIELARGIPIITFLFMAAVMFPLFVPQGLSIDKLVRAQIALVLVMSAYLAEVVRAGLQAVPEGQYEAAASMGLSYWPSMILIVLPQALRGAIPAIVNTFIAFFKDTSLVAVIGLFDLLGAAKSVIADPEWAGFGVEIYLFVGAIYFAFCYSASRYSRHLEKRLMARARQ